MTWRASVKRKREALSDATVTVQQVNRQLRFVSVVQVKQATVDKSEYLRELQAVTDVEGGLAKQAAVPFDQRQLEIWAQRACIDDDLDSADASSESAWQDMTKSLEVAVWMKDHGTVQAEAARIAKLCSSFKWASDDAEAFQCAIVQLCASSRRAIFSQLYSTKALSSLLADLPFLLMSSFARDCLAQASQMQSCKADSVRAAEWEESQHLQLSARSNGPVGASAMLRGLQGCIKGDTAARLCMFLPHMQDLKTVYMADHGMGDDNLAMVILALSALPGLLHLDLCRNAGGEMAARTLVSALTKWSKLQALHYTGNAKMASDRQASTVAALANGLQCAVTLRELVIADIPSQPALDSALQQLTDLTKLALACGSKSVPCSNALCSLSLGPDGTCASVGLLRQVQCCFNLTSLCLTAPESEKLWLPGNLSFISLQLLQSLELKHFKDGDVDWSSDEEATTNNPLALSQPEWVPGAEWAPHIVWEDNRYDGLLSLRYCSNLTHLCLGKGDFLALLGHVLPHMPQLIELNLNEYVDEEAFPHTAWGLAHAPGLRSLTAMLLPGARLLHCAPAKAPCLTALQKLDLKVEAVANKSGNGTEVQWLADQLPELRSLQELKLAFTDSSKCTARCWRLLRRLRKLHRLHTLHLEGADISKSSSASALMQLPTEVVSLRNLTLQKCKLGHELRFQLGVSLNTLRLRYCSCSESAMLALRSAVRAQQPFHQLQVVDVAGQSMPSEQLQAWLDVMRRCPQISTLVVTFGHASSEANWHNTVTAFNAEGSKSHGKCIVEAHEEAVAWEDLI